MRALVAVSVMAVFAAGCASRTDVRAQQMPASSPQGVIRFEPEHEYRDAVTIEWVDRASRRWFLFADPSQRFRPVLEDALENAGLRARTPYRARYGLRVEVANNPSTGADMNSEVVANYVIVDRQRGGEVWRREIRSPGAARLQRALVTAQAQGGAARASHAAVATNVSEFLKAFAADNGVAVTPILPCWGSPEEEALKLELLSSGRSFTTDNCMAPR